MFYVGSDGMGVHIENLVNISNGTMWNNKELIMRIETDVKDSDNQLCVDLNGFQVSTIIWDGRLDWACSCL